MDRKIEELLEKGKEMKTQGQKVLKKEKKTITRAIHAWAVEIQMVQFLSADAHVY